MGRPDLLPPTVPQQSQTKRTNNAQAPVCARNIHPASSPSSSPSTSAPPPSSYPSSTPTSSSSSSTFRGGTVADRLALVLLRQDRTAFVGLSSSKSKAIQGTLGCFNPPRFPTSFKSSRIWGFQASPSRKRWWRDCLSSWLHYQHLSDVNLRIVALNLQCRLMAGQLTASHSLCQQWSRSTALLHLAELQHCPMQQALQTTWRGQNAHLSMNEYYSTEACG